MLHGKYGHLIMIPITLAVPAFPNIPVTFLEEFAFASRYSFAVIRTFRHQRLLLYPARRNQDLDVASDSASECGKM